MGTELQKIEIEDSLWDGRVGCCEILNRSAPEIIRKIHQNYIKSGADIIKTNTFGALPWVLEEYDLQDECYNLAYLGAKLVEDSIKSVDIALDSSLFIAGSLGPGTKLPSLGHIDFDTMYEGYKCAALGLIDGGVSLFLLETAQDPLQIKSAILALKDAMLQKEIEIPILVSVTIETSGTMLIGTDIQTLGTILEPFDIFSIGINCGLGPKEAKSYIKTLSQCTNKPISIHANAGLPQNRGGCTHYPMEPLEFAKREAEFLEFPNVSILGGCCGTTPLHIKALKERVGTTAPKRETNILEPSVASLYRSVPIRQNPPPLLIGERSNATGSKAFRDLLLKEDFEGVLSVAQAQVEKLSHLLDVSVAFAGRDELGDMRRVSALYSQKITLPLMPDSTSVEALEISLKNIGGRAIINSANFEDGDLKFDKICKLAKRFGAALVCLTIDEEGMAKTKDRKIEIAKRAYDRATKLHHIKESDIIFDVLTFTIASGDEEYFLAGVETIEAIRELSLLYPNANSTLGLSNISFGLDKSARIYLNSIFLHHCIKAGLTTAIVNSAHLIPYFKIEQKEREICENLIFNYEKSQKPLFSLIEHFKDHTLELQKCDNRANLEPKDRLKSYLIDGKKDKILEELVEIKEIIEPEIIINEILIDAMKVVGEKFGNGEMQLPFVLQSAEVMKASVEYLKPFLPKKEGDAKSAPILILGTVKGDVHDVGKNLVDIILSNNGFKVVNIGIKAEIGDFINAFKEHNASAIGMSGLLVKSTQIMKENLLYLEEEGITCPILLGGAALNRAFIDDYCRPNYKGIIFYCKDAFDGIRAMSKILKGELESYELSEQSEIAKIEEIDKKIEDTTFEPLEIENPKKAPFLGRRVLEIEDKELIFKWLNMGVLYKSRWGYQKKNLSKSEYEKSIEESAKPNFERLKELFIKDNIFSPVAIYGYYRCKVVDESLLIYGDDDREYILNFPRQRARPRRSIVDYFNPQGDVVALSIVSSGVNLAPFESELYRDGKFAEYFLVHGLGVELAEALAEIVHKRVRVELGVAKDEGESLSDVRVQKYVGQRYSFGYPACPDLELNEALFALLKPEEFGIKLSETYQIDPEASTSALITVHKSAKYFSI